MSRMLHALRQLESLPFSSPSAAVLSSSSDAMVSSSSPDRIEWTETEVIISQPVENHLSATQIVSCPDLEIDVSTEGDSITSPAIDTLVEAFTSAEPLAGNMKVATPEKDRPESPGESWLSSRCDKSAVVARPKIADTPSPPPLEPRLSGTSCAGRVDSHRPVRTFPRAFPRQAVVPRPLTGLETQVAHHLNSPFWGPKYREFSANLVARLPRGTPATIAMMEVGASHCTSVLLPHLGAALADTEDDEVLLVDAEWSQRRLSRHLELNDKSGFAEVLHHQVDWRSLVVSSGFSKLSVLPAGQATIPREVDISDIEARALWVLRDLVNEFSLVIVDGGGLGNVVAESICRWCDVTILAAELGRHKRDVLADVPVRLRESGHRLLGCVLVDMPRKALGP